MPIKPPEGFLTRPEAAKVFNRSQRALERDLDLALSMQDSDVLGHWCLVTKDGEVRSAALVATNEVKQLVTDGMTPAWCIDENWLEREYGRKGVSKAPKSRDANRPPPPSIREVQDSEQPDTVPAPSLKSPLQSDIAFLQERIRTLEREKQGQAERSENREAKLFEQLAVKDNQIHKWDEITQGLARGLATGQLVPSLLRGQSDAASDRPAGAVAESDSQPAPEVTVVEPASRTKTKRAKNTTSAKSKPKRKRSKSVFEKHTPTFHRVASGLLRRS